LLLGLHRRVRSIWVAAFFAVALMAFAASAALAGTPTRTARSCTPPKYPGVGYFTTLTVKGTSCATGKKLVLAYYRCRIRNGKAGRCHSTVLGYTCHEKRNTIPTEIDARVTCRRHTATVVHTYQQDT
jgi:hypothetical protein